EEVVRAVKAARSINLPCFILGGGSNLLVSDKGFDGLVVRVEVPGLKLLGQNEIECGAGESLQALVDFATENSLTGLEFASGIWGTVGGAIYGNAGAYGGEIGSVVTQVTLVDRDGKIKQADQDYCRFGYRDSYLKQSGEVVTRARIQLRKGDQDEIRRKSREIQAIRIQRHPVKGYSAGCFFKNIPDSSQEHGKIPAGRLLEEVGAKQMSLGGAKVWDKHANIIVNTGTATSADIRRLADILKQKVYAKFGIKLEEEVIHLGPFD
ncbi:MAG: UDP-N-acetylmuramate dehydrogenase, partial [Candidatus Zixiibacteriota bacterium]